MSCESPVSGESWLGLHRTEIFQFVDQPETCLAQAHTKARCCGSSRMRRISRDIFGSGNALLTENIEMSIFAVPDCLANPPLASLHHWVWLHDKACAVAVHIADQLQSAAAMCKMSSGPTSLMTFSSCYLIIRPCDPASVILQPTCRSLCPLSLSRSILPFGLPKSELTPCFESHSRSCCTRPR